MYGILGSALGEFAIVRFAKDDSGATAIEYSLIAALISLVIVGSLAHLNEDMVAMYGYVSEHIGSALHSGN